MAGGEDEEKENNFYLDYLRTLRDSTIPNAKSMVYDGSASNPGSDIQALIDDEGWVCDAATDWVTEMKEHTAKILPAFDDAIDDVKAAITAEEAAFPGDGHQVPKGHPHGVAYQNTVRTLSRPYNQYGGPGY